MNHNRYWSELINASPAGNAERISILEQQIAACTGFGKNAAEMWLEDWDHTPLKEVQHDYLVTLTCYSLNQLTEVLGNYELPFPNRVIFDIIILAMKMLDDYQGAFDDVMERAIKLALASQESMQ